MNGELDDAEVRLRRALALPEFASHDSGISTYNLACVDGPLTGMRDASCGSFQPRPWLAKTGFE